ncbi:MAG: hypothetical protein NTW87_24600, partial [Planctomycetota bacterium]|nr:hypothetical protein [Planctomycetota bacterium]
AMDASGQTYTASAGIYVSPEHLDVRMSANPSIAVHGSTVEVEVSVKNSANAPVQHAKVRLERPELTAETGQDGRAVFKVKVPDKGDRELLAVRVEANNLQQSTSQEVRLVTQQADPVAAEQKVEHRYDRLSVHSAWCAAGEEMEVSLSVDTVSSAESTVLLFIENTRLLACRAVRVARGEHKVRIPTDIGFAPQCTIEVVLMTGSKSRTSTSVGYVTPKAKQLSLEITTDRRNYKPGDQCTAEAVVKDHAGLPVANAEISLGVVQEPLYEVAGDRTPNLFHELHSYAMPHYPVGAFEQPAPASHPVLLWKGPKYAWGYLDVLYDSWGFGMDSGSGHGSFGARYGGGRALMVSRHGGSRAVAGDECEAQVRRQFRTTAHWVASLLTDEDGRARCQFAFPDDITEWRFTARGLTADTSVGEVHVSRHTLLPIQAEIVLPRGLRAGDRITTAAVIYENAQVQRALTVDCGVGAQRVVSQVSLKPHGIARVDLPVPPQSEGEVVLGVTARDLNTQNADASERKLTVLPRGYTHAWRHFGEASAGGEVNLDFGSTTPDTRRVTIKLEAGFAGPVASALQELIQYPYGCVEQTMSRFMPATVAARAMKDARLTYSGSVNLERVLSEGVVRLTGFQHADGGWGWWKEDATNDLMTAYVLEGLTLCRRAGHVIPAGLTDRAEEYLFGKVEAGVCDGRQVGSIGDVDVGEFAAHALAVYLNAEPDKHAAHRARLADLIDARPLAAAVTPRERVLRLDTLRLLGRTDVARQELRTTLGNLKLDFSAAGNRRSLMTLATLLELGRAVDADNARWFTLGRQLIERRHGAGWGDTLATAAAVRGLSALLQPAGQTRGSLSVLADGKPVAQLTLGKPDQESVQLGAEITHAKRLVLRTEGDVTDTFWSMRVEGRSATPPPNPTQPVVTVRCEVLDPQNNLAVIPVNEKKQLQVQRGKTLKVRLACTLNASQTCVRLTFPRPCGVEMIRPPKFVDGIVAFEQRDDAIHFFISHWEAGNHSVEFGIRAEVSGDVFAPRPEFAPMYGNTPPVSVDAPDSWQIQP